MLSLPEEFNWGKNRNLVCRIEAIGYNCFDGFKELKTLCIPASVKDIKWCFYGCNNLQNIIVAEGNPKYESIDGVLYSKNHKLIAFPNARTGKFYVDDKTVEIMGSAFKGSRIEEIVVPKSVKKICKNAFYQC